ncbi:MAG: MBL fold metallo-hydrolase RNA specificity domain-containing protein [Spirosomataceae bacterium]
MKLTFFGAARQVTGSMFLLELSDGYKILVDCGVNLDRKSRDEQREESQFGIFPFEASLLNLVILTHAHIDHSGQIPNLYREGYEGQVLCTNPTLELTDLLLQDAARINQKKLKSIQKSKKKSKKTKSIDSEELYFGRQVEEAISNFVPIEFGRTFKFHDRCSVQFVPAGHLLGAAHVILEIWDEGKIKKICFSGDIGRQNYPLLVDPQPVPDVDYLVMETTYGNRYHQDKISPEEALKRVIKEACIDKPGRLIIPAFSVGRTQAMLYTLNKLYENHEVEPIKVFTDSPLGKASTKVYEKYHRLLNKEAREFKEENEHLFDFANLHYLESTKESQEVSNHGEPCIILSSSGMVQGGRVEYHIEQNIENPYATILMIGYATEGTIGYKLLHREQKELTINNKKHAIQAQIEKIDVFSGHGDLNDLINFVEQQRPESLKKVFLVHGEESSMEHFKGVLAEKGFSNVEIPSYHQTFEL